MIKSEDPRLEDDSTSKNNNIYLTVYVKLTKKIKFMNENIGQCINTYETLM